MEPHILHWTMNLNTSNRVTRVQLGSSMKLALDGESG